MELLAYLRVSTREQGDSGKGIAAQRRKIRVFAEASDHTIIDWHTDVHSGKDGNGRPELQQCLDRLADGDGDGMVVATLDRASRSIVHGASLLEAANDEGWSFIALDVGMDTSTSTGRMMANLHLVLAQWERERIAERTSDALQEAKAQGKRLGRPSTVDPKVLREIVKLRADDGMSMQNIADHLNGKGIRTASGKLWRQPTISRALRTHALDEEAKRA